MRILYVNVRSRIQFRMKPHGLPAVGIGKQRNTHSQWVYTENLTTVGAVLVSVSARFPKAFLD